MLAACAQWETPAPLALVCGGREEAKAVLTQCSALDAVAVSDISEVHCYE